MTKPCPVCGRPHENLCQFPTVPEFQPHPLFSDAAFRRELNRALSLLHGYRVRDNWRKLKLSAWAYLYSLFER